MEASKLGYYIVSTSDLSKVLFRNLLLPFEVTSASSSWLPSLALSRSHGRSTEMVVPIVCYLILSAILFYIGIAGF